MHRDQILEHAREPRSYEEPVLVTEAHPKLSRFRPPSSEPAGSVYRGDKLSMTDIPSRLDLDRLIEERPRLKALARRLLADEHGAEDVVQDAWIKALERPPRQASSVGAWMHEVVRTLALKRSQGERRSREREERVARRELATGEDAVQDRLRTQREVLDAVLDLDEPLRSTVHARYFDELPPRVIARRQDISIDTVNDRLKRARRLLRANLERRLAEDERAAWGLALLPLAELSPRAGAWLQAELSGGVASGAGALEAAVTTNASPQLLGDLLMLKKTLTASILVIAAIGVSWKVISDNAASPEAAEGPSVAALAGQDPPAKAEKAEDLVVNAEAVDERVVVQAAPNHVSVVEDWIVRGRVFFGSSTPASHTKVRARLWAGFENDGPARLDVLLTSDAEGRLEWSLEAPEETISLQWTLPEDTHPGYGDESLVVPGDGPPQELSVNLYPMDVTIVGTVMDEQGDPLEGATVSGSSDVVTDEAGKYRVKGSSFRSQEFVHASAAGHARVRASVEMPEAGEEVVCDFSLRKAFVIRGRVLDESGTPIARASVSSFFSARSHVTTDSQGAFALEHLDPGRENHSISIKAKGYVTHTESIDTGSGEPVEKEFVLHRGVLVAGHVIDSKGSPILGARICLGFSTNAWNALWAYSMEEGEFRIENAPRGEQTLWVEREGFAALKHVILVPEAGELMEDVLLELDAGRSISGRVVDDEQRGVPDVQVRPRFEGDLVELTTKTDAEGAFSLEHVPSGEVEMSYYRKDWERVKQTLAPGDQHGLRVVMNPSGCVAGRVVDASTGEPVENFRVRLTRVSEEPGLPPIPLWSTWTREGHAFSDRHGEWRTSDLELPVGREVAAEIRAEGYASSGFKRVRITASPEPDGLIIALSRGRRVTGRVVDKGTGAPVVGARVSYQDDPELRMEALGSMSFADTWDSYATSTNAAGEFAFENVMPQKLRIEIEHGDYERNTRSGPHVIEAEGPDPKLLIEIGGAGGIRGVVLDAAGNARAGVALVLIGVEVRGVAGQFRKTVTTDSKGSFRFGELADGYYRVQEEVAGGAESSGVRVGSGVLLHNASTAKITLQPAGDGTLFGSWSAEGDVPARVELTLMILPERVKGAAPPVGHPLFTATVKGKEFELTGLPAGKYLMETLWTKDGYAVHGKPLQFELQAGQATRQEFELRNR